MNNKEDNYNDELSEFLKKVDGVQIPTKQSKEVLRNKIIASIDGHEHRKSRQIIWPFVGIAASITIIAVFYMLFTNQSPDINVVTATTSEIITKALPDGSQVVLNTSSSIDYSESWNREITLEGEAFFEVTKGEKFTVKTSLGNIQVLGTSFNVYVRKGNFEVACKTGKVSVSIPSKKVEEIIEPGEMISFRSDTVKRTFSRAELIGTWQKGEFYFRERPLAEVFDEVQRQFNIKIEFEEPNNQTFTGYFVKGNPETALEMVCLPLGLNYHEVGKGKFLVNRSVQ